MNIETVWNQIDSFLKLFGDGNHRKITILMFDPDKMGHWIQTTCESNQEQFIIINRIDPNPHNSLNIKIMEMYNPMEFSTQASKETDNLRNNKMFYFALLQKGNKRIRISWKDLEPFYSMIQLTDMYLTNVFQLQREINTSLTSCERWEDQLNQYKENLQQFISFLSDKQLEIDSYPLELLEKVSALLDMILEICSKPRIVQKHIPELAKRFQL